MTTHFKDTAYYRNLNPLILYGDTWLYGAALPSANIGIPTGVYVLHEKEYNIISWDNPTSSDIVGYYIYRSSTIGHTDIKPLATILDTDSNGNTNTCYVDYLLDSELDTQYYYAVASINSADYVSFISEWAADISIENSFTSRKYLYTNQLTQSYWTIVDLYKRLSNIDTDRNIIPFRDRGNTYKQVYTDTGFPNMYLRGELAVEDGYLNNQGNAEVGYLTEGSDSSRLIPKNVPVKIDCNYLYCTLLPTNDKKKYTFYMDDIPLTSNISSTTVTAYIYESDDLGNLSNLLVDKTAFSSKVSSSGTYNFYWNDVYNYWQTETEEVNLEEFGITYTGTPEAHNVISVDFSIVGYVYFRVPYIYNSKILQTYIKSEDDVILNKFAFKAYNHLIFASTLGKIFNDIQIDLKKSEGNLYTTDVSDKAVYKNFASYFNFEQPAWLNNANYRNCVLGNNNTGEAGLWQAGIHGGTQLGLEEAVTALASGNVTISSVADIDYLTMYHNYKPFDATEINIYDENETYSANDIILYNDNFFSVLNGTDITIPVQAFTELNSTTVSCVNNNYKDTLFVVNYDSTNPISVTVLSETDTVTCNKYDLININSHFYEVRKAFNYFYSLLACTSTAPSTYNIPNGTFYYNTSSDKLYKIVAGAWEESASDLKTDAIYFDQSSGLIYEYNTTKLVDQTSLRLVDKICEILNVATPLNLQAIYSLNLKDADYYLTFLEIPEEEHEYIFKDDKYITPANTDPVSYTHAYITNTYKIEFNNWTRPTKPEKYLVYGNKLKLNNQNIIYPSSSFVVSVDEAQTNEIPITAYNVNSKNGILTWTDSPYKPEDGSYVYIKYTVDIRPDIKKIIELFKFPQVNIDYVWVE